MSLATVKKALRQLPYMEMRDLAFQVGGKLSIPTDNSPSIAEALATLPLDSGDALQRDEEILKEVFRRKLAITIRPADIGGWYEISMASGPTVRSNCIRDGLLEFMETLVAYKALEK